MLVFTDAGLFFVHAPVRFADEYVERYSSGMKQRIAIAKALLADPPVALPTPGHAGLALTTFLPASSGHVARG